MKFVGVGEFKQAAVKYLNEGDELLLQFQQSASLQEVEGFYFFNLAEHEQLGWILGPKDVFSAHFLHETFPGLKMRA